ncbi:MAG: hypothetical protein AAF458_05200 [Pseudomonadota bacterium]
MTCDGSLAVATRFGFDLVCNVPDEAWPLMRAAMTPVSAVFRISLCFSERLSAAPDAARRDLVRTLEEVPAGCAQTWRLDD